jgi:hypothetical protein
MPHIVQLERYRIATGTANMKARSYGGWEELAQNDKNPRPELRRERLYFYNRNF